MSVSVTAPQGEGQSTRGASAAPASCAGDLPGAQGGFDDELLQLAAVTLEDLHDVTNPKVLQHLQQRVAGFAGLSAKALAALSPERAYWVPSEATDPAWRGQAQEVYVRPARCQHGGHTRAVL